MNTSPVIDGHTLMKLGCHLRHAWQASSRASSHVIITKVVGSSVARNEQLPTLERYANDGLVELLFH